MSYPIHDILILKEENKQSTALLKNIDPSCKNLKYYLKILMHFIALDRIWPNIFKNLAIFVPRILQKY
jgi:hypothetical protein